MSTLRFDINTETIPKTVYTCLDTRNDSQLQTFTLCLGNLHALIGVLALFEEDSWIRPQIRVLSDL